MTRSAAERITGLIATMVAVSPKHHECNLYLERTGEPPFVTGHGYTPAEAISRAVAANYRRIAERCATEQSHRCFVCGRIPSQGLQTDHISPRARGRDDRRNNLRNVCPECHRQITDLIISKPQPHPKVLESVRKHGLDWDREANRWVDIAEARDTSRSKRSRKLSSASV